MDEENILRYIQIIINLSTFIIFTVAVRCLYSLAGNTYRKYLFMKDHVKCGSCGLTLFCLNKVNQDDCFKIKEERRSYKIDGLKYCCPLKCMVDGFDQVDGLACVKCESFGLCRCDCTTYQYRRKYKKELFL
ncbi:hypothetical protein WA026_012706 [Henosepilachna vigintioctopunctata]|uniref:Uncharacterized protein n=2 Tax=Henosepilachna vigintioctopunctata TaxID=420089 RepID=A0AAW1U8J7_9CUCU